MQIWEALHVVMISQWLTSSSTPAGRPLHVPSCPGSAHDVQVVHVAELQQTDSTQCLLAHCPPLVHVDPSDPELELELPPAPELELPLPLELLVAPELLAP